MYLSQLKLNPARRVARELLLNPYRLHQAVYRAFPNKEEGGPGRVLYRVDESRRSNTVHLVVQSDNEPNWQAADFITDCLLEPAAYKPYSPALQTGQILHFRVRANPSVKKKAEGKKNGYRLGLIQEEDQVMWLKHKGETAGFALISCDTVPEGIIQNERRNMENEILRHFAVRFEGVLKITDKVIFTETIENGIGSAKGFGFGLLSLALI